MNRRIVLGCFVCIGMLACTAAPRLSDSSGRTGQGNDYIQYWAASRLNQSGQDPYDWDRMLSMQRRIQASLATPVMMWNPPCALTLTTPFGLLPFSWSRFVWMFIAVWISSICCSVLWIYWGGRPALCALSMLLGLVFTPSVLAVGMGQITPFLLLGVVGFLTLEGKGKRDSWLTGAPLSLTLVKPHVVYLVWVGMVLWAVAGRRWKVLAGAFSAVVLMCVIPVLANPHLWAQYVLALQSHPPNYWVAPTTGTLMRLLVGWEKMWPAFVPSLIGTLWFVWYWVRCRSGWTWKRHISVVLFVSVITAPYSWVFDQIVLLVPAVQLAVLYVASPSRRTRWAVAIFTFTAGLALVLWPWPALVVRPNTQAATNLLRLVFFSGNMFWHIVLAPLFLVAFLLVRDTGSASAMTN